MFLPNTTGMLSRRTGKDVYGQGVYAAAVSVPCAVVSLAPVVMKSPIRTDSSASRGAAEEIDTKSKILFPKTVQVGDGDKFTILGSELRVITVQPRNNVLGTLDHYEVDLGAWAA